MRVSFAVLIAVVAVITSSGLGSASKSAQYNVENADRGPWFLRKRLENENDGLTGEERGILGNVGTKIKQYLNGEQKIAKLFKKTDAQLLKKDVGPIDLINGAKRLENAGWPAAKVEQFKAKGRQYQEYFYNNFKDVKGT